TPVLSLKWNVSLEDAGPPRRFCTFAKVTLCSVPKLIPVMVQSLGPKPLTTVLAPGPPLMNTGVVDEGVWTKNVSLLPAKTSTALTPGRKWIGDPIPAN